MTAQQLPSGGLSNGAASAAQAAASAAPPARKRRAHMITPKTCIVGCCFLATFAAYVERVGFSIAFTAMAKGAALDEAVKGNVLSAFYWGYGVSQVWGCGVAIGAPSVQAEGRVRSIRPRLACSGRPCPPPPRVLRVRCPRPTPCQTDPRRLGCAALGWACDAHCLLPGLVPGLPAHTRQRRQRGAHRGRACDGGPGPRGAHSLGAHRAVAGVRVRVRVGLVGQRVEVAHCRLGSLSS
jgi:hypothetical protein